MPLILPNTCTFFQRRFLEIDMTARKICACLSAIDIYVDSFAVKSKSPNDFVNYHKVKGNEKANECAVRRSL